MANALQMNDAAPTAGLGTFSYTIPVGFLTQMVTISIQSTLPLSSGLQIVLQQTGSASVSVTMGGVAANPTPTQTSLGGALRVLAVAGDVISAVLTSSAAADQLPNAVKSTINLFMGE